jgi:hypothetical protein
MDPYILPVYLKLEVFSLPIDIIHGASADGHTPADFIITLTDYTSYSKRRQGK